jgi:Flp pilus assembly protein TadD
MSLDEEVTGLVLRAQHLQAIKRYREAAALWAQAVAGNPGDTDLRCGWAVALFLADQRPAALDAAWTAVAASPDSTVAHCVLGALLVTAGHAGHAVELAQRAPGPGLPLPRSAGPEGGRRERLPPSSGRVSAVSR